MGEVSQKTKDKISKSHIGLFSLSNNPNWKGGLVEYNCDYCGQIIELKQCEYKKTKKHYCSKECKSKDQIGENISEETKLKISKKLSNYELNGGNNPNARKVICITTNKVFNSIIEASTYYNIPSSG